MSQTREDRMWRHYKSLRKTAAQQGFDPNWKWLQLARTWQMPVRQVKDIIAARKGPTMEPVWCCEEYCFVEGYREVTPAEQAAKHEIAQTKSAIDALAQAVPERACDACDAPTADWGDDYHRDGCPDLGGKHRDGEEWYEHSLRHLHAALTQWQAIVAVLVEDPAQ